MAISKTSICSTERERGRRQRHLCLKTKSINHVALFFANQNKYGNAKYLIIYLIAGQMSGYYSSYASGFTAAQMAAAAAAAAAQSSQVKKG